MNISIIRDHRTKYRKKNRLTRYNNDAAVCVFYFFFLFLLGFLGFGA